MMIVAVAVVVIAGFAIYRLHGIFGSHNNASGGQRHLE
ncbi:membrane protein [Mycobacterium pseudoshottsii JCM 15466]|nr:membrane protein [Mycobacterium pseudoshottsii JCM 15466]